MADLLGALRGNVGSSVPRNPGVGGLALLPALGSAGAGARCWSCSPVKELEGVQVLVPWHGRAGSWLAVAELGRLEGCAGLHLGTFCLRCRSGKMKAFRWMRTSSFVRRLHNRIILYFCCRLET